ncbi:hypothetical protein ACHHYP_01655 [Achlya hypogyna]|uniref:Ubiquitin-like protease family profile domain-containing protein n=1 Tax=Achlya hypogyna TaxID=1202772 RepID=A0A1V9Z852_ACHHY|nr:hypothetical protein ACHHYP_01655 [Achlya hypogyna]
MSDESDSDVPAWNSVTRKINPRFVEALDTVVTPESKRRKFGLSANATTTKAAMYEPVTRKSLEAKKIEEAKKRKRSRGWDNDQPTVSLGSPAPPGRPLYSTTKAITKPRLQTEAVGGAHSVNKSSRIVPGMAIMKPSTPTGPEYSSKISGSLSTYATKPLMRSVFSTTSTTGTLETASGGKKIYTSLREGAKSENSKKTSSPVKRPRLNSKPTASPPVDAWRSKRTPTTLYNRSSRLPTFAGSTDPLDLRLVARRTSLPTITSFASSKKKPVGTADKPISFSSDEESGAEEKRPLPETDAGCLRCESVYVGKKEFRSPALAVRVKRDGLYWDSERLAVLEIGHVQFFEVVHNDIPAFVALSLKNLNSVALGSRQFVVFIAKDPDEIAPFLAALRKIDAKIWPTRLHDAEDAIGFLADVPGYGSAVPAPRPKRPETEELQRKTRGGLRRPRASEKIVVAYPLPPATVDVISITEDDMARLEPNVYLNDNLIDFYFKYERACGAVAKSRRWLQAGPCADTKAYCLCVGALFFPALQDKYDRVATWFGFDDLFTKEVVVVPINMHTHWSVAMIFNLPQMALPAAERAPSLMPTIAFMDSMGSAHKKSAIFKVLVDYLQRLYASRTPGPGCDAALDSELFARFTVAAPQQTNAYDCGVYVLLSAHMVLQAYNGLRSQHVGSEPFGVSTSMASDRLAGLIRPDTYDAATVAATRVAIRQTLQELAAEAALLKTASPSNLALQELSLAPESTAAANDEDVQMLPSSTLVSNEAPEELERVATHSDAPNDDGVLRLVVPPRRQAEQLSPAAKGDSSAVELTSPTKLALTTEEDEDEVLLVEAQDVTFIV